MSTSILIRGIDVEFPYTPYASQVDYMTAVMDTLNTGGRGILEAPTGTGKTLCLLCASLAWTIHAQKQAIIPGALVQRDHLLRHRTGSGSSNNRRVMNEAGQTKIANRIVYTSRTHAQLAQVARELKKTAYASQVEMAILGSRDHMCIHNTISKLPNSDAVNRACNAARAEQSCRFYKRIQFMLATPMKLRLLSSAGGVVSDNADDYVNQNTIATNGASNSGGGGGGGLQAVHDMEDLVKCGRSQGFCPYFYERCMSQEAQIVLLPYSYLFDPSIRRQLPFSLEDCILIIDEAHNLPSVLSQSANTTITPLDITTAMHELGRAIGMNREAIATATASGDRQREQLLLELEEGLGVVKLCLAQLEDVIVDVATTSGQSLQGPRTGTGGNVQPPQQQPANLEVVLGGNTIFELLRRAEITVDRWRGRPVDAITATSGQDKMISDIITEGISILANSDAGSNGLMKVEQFLNNVFSVDMTTVELDSCCRVVLQGQPVARDGHRIRWTLGFWCLDITAVMQRALEGVKSLVVTSGTLSPLDHFAAELGVSFDVSLEGAHVIQPSQVMATVLCRGPNGQALNAGYAFRNSEAYRMALGYSLLNIARNVPSGMLVFFPSYAAQNGALDLWKLGTGGGAGSGGGVGGKTLWSQLSELKTLFEEPTDASELKVLTQKFQAAAEEAHGAILFAVCRGKVSEGIDFADHHARCVVVAGIPYANQTDLFVRLKRQYLTMVAPQRPRVHGKLFTGDDWYRQEAMRSVNQAIGRVIRHKDDYGVIVLADERFVQQRESVSKWVQRSLVVHSEFGEAYAAITKFFLERRRHRSAPAAGSSSSSPASCDRSSALVTALKPSTASLAEAYQHAAMEKRQQELEEERKASTIHMSGIPTAAPNSEAKKPQPAIKTVAFAKQNISAATEVVHESEAAPRQAATPSSKAFCDGLRSLLSPDDYKTFRVLLGELTQCVRRLSGSGSGSASPPGALDEVKSQVLRTLTDLIALFRRGITDENKCKETLEAFAMHIPGHVKDAYLKLCSKRPRGSS